MDKNEEAKTPATEGSSKIFRVSYHVTSTVFMLVVSSQVKQTLAHRMTKIIIMYHYKTNNHNDDSNDGCNEADVNITMQIMSD